MKIKKKILGVLKISYLYKNGIVLCWNLDDGNDLIRGEQET